MNFGRQKIDKELNIPLMCQSEQFEDLETAHCAVCFGVSVDCRVKCSASEKHVLAVKGQRPTLLKEQILPGLLSILFFCVMPIWNPVNMPGKKS